MGLNGDHVRHAAWRREVQPLLERGLVVHAHPPSDLVDVVLEAGTHDRRRHLLATFIPLVGRDHSLTDVEVPAVRLLVGVGVPAGFGVVIGEVSQVDNTELTVLT